MPNEPPDRAEVQAHRALIDGFIHERLTPKLEEIDKKIIRETDLGQLQELQSKRQQLLEDYQRQPWLENAARRVNQIQLVTHAIKFTHPNARGSSLFVHAQPSMVENYWVSTEMLGENCQPDVVGNAAALDVYKFLMLEYQGKALLQGMIDADPALLAALSDDQEQAEIWRMQFAAITGSKTSNASHSLAKQLYFPLSSDGYHLLAPLFPTSLAHALHERMRKARFSDAAKQARQAHKDKKPFAHGFGDYPKMAVQIFGGTKPQNISQLNSERYGEGWLLPSFPPTWRSDTIRPPLGVKTVFRRWFGGRPAARELTSALAKFLTSTHHNNVYIRRTRARLVDRLCDELVQFAAELRELDPGWTAQPECRLDQAEALWLDPGRTLEDETFFSLYQRRDWQDEIASRFGNWLNGQLRYHAPLPLGDAEHAEWQRVVEHALDGIKEELAHD